MNSTAFKVIAIAAICFSIYSLLSPNSPKLYGDHHLTTKQINKRITITTANLMFRSQMKQCDYDYEKRSPEWQICIKSGLKQLRKETIEQLNKHHN